LLFTHAQISNVKRRRICGGWRRSEHRVPREDHLAVCLLSLALIHNNIRLD